MRPVGYLVVGALICGCVGVGCDKKTPSQDKTSGIQHRASIPIIPRGKVVVATAKGERYLIEIEARLPLTQAVTFYRRQLAREGWSALRVQKVSDGLWGIAAERGMFELTGRIKQAKPGVVSIGFERKVKKRADAVVPPVPKDVPVLTGQIEWRGPFYEARGGRTEIRGTSALGSVKLGKTLVAALRLKGWTVKKDNGQIQAVKKLTRTLSKDTVKAEARKAQQQGYTVKILSDGKTLDAERRLTYHVAKIGARSRIRMVVAYAELTPSRARVKPRPAVSDAGVGRPRPPASANVVTLPADLLPWKTQEPVLGVKQSTAVQSFSLDRKCSTPSALLLEILKTLTQRGFKRMVAGRLVSKTPVDPGTTTATLVKKKRAVVVMVSRELEDCTVRLTLLRP